MVHGEEANSMKLNYAIDSAPAIHICILLGFQQFLTSMGASIAMPSMVAEASCMGPDLVGRAELMGSLLFLNGIGTLIQVYVGVRLPILQGASFAFVAPIMAMQSIEQFKCPSDSDYESGRIVPGSDEHRALWMSRLIVIQGGVLLSGVFETIIGMTGLVGLIFKYIGPLTVAPTTALIGLCLVEDSISQYAAKNWPIAGLTLALVILFSLYLCNVRIPFPAFIGSIRQKPRYFKIGISWQPLFGLFPVLLAILTSWAICAILTTAGAFPDTPHGGYGYAARTDIRQSQLTAAPWIRIPYPGQWGSPQIFVAVVLGMMAGTISSVVESIGDYCACARICRVPRPPPHAINRGITAEGLGCILAGLFGSGPGVTSYSENIGAIGITGVASRRVVFTTALLLMICGSVTKVAAVFVSIPDPVIGGIFIAMFSMVASVGFSNLQFIDLNCTRNLLIFGLSMFLGLAMPMWVKRDPSVIKTGSEVVDQILIVLLSTGMLVGGLIGFILDNTVPGATRKQRGLDVLENELNSNETVLDFNNGAPTLSSHDTYNLPLIGGWIERQTFLRYVPISPSFRPKNLAHLNVCRKKREAKNHPIQEASSINVISTSTTIGTDNLGLNLEEATL